MLFMLFALGLFVQGSGMGPLQRQAKDPVDFSKLSAVNRADTSCRRHDTLQRDKCCLNWGWSRYICIGLHIL